MDRTRQKDVFMRARVKVGTDSCTGAKTIEEKSLHPSRLHPSRRHHPLRISSMGNTVHRASITKFLTASLHSSRSSGLFTFLPRTDFCRGGVGVWGVTKYGKFFTLRLKIWFSQLKKKLIKKTKISIHCQKIRSVQPNSSTNTG